MVEQQEFDKNIEKFKALNDFRDEVETISKDLIERNEEVLGLCLMLFSWNFANMRNMLKTFSIHKFKEILKEINPIFKELQDERFETANFDNLSEEISFIFNKLNPLIQYTGTSKVMYFKNPNLFVMWDTAIRKKWGIKKFTAQDYIDFLKLMQKEFKNLNWENKEVSFARAIDMYNYAMTQKKS